MPEWNGKEIGHYTLKLFVKCYPTFLLLLLLGLGKDKVAKALNGGRSLSLVGAMFEDVNSLPFLSTLAMVN